MAEGWRPNDGDTLKGKVTTLEQGWSDYQNKFYPIVTLKDSSGTDVSVHCFHSILERKMKAIRPKIGDTLEVTYIGKQETKDGKRSFANYEVTSDRPIDADAFWGAQAGPVGPVAPAEDDIPF
jgi:hypothetical protein